MENLSEVLKILEGALRANSSMSANYAGLLADKLDQAGERNQARLIRSQLSKAPSALASAQDAARGVSLNHLPSDNESRLNTVDVSYPSKDNSSLYLPSGIKVRINEFIDSIVHYDELARANASQPNRLLIFGKPGTGKTKLAHWIASKLDYPLLTVRCDSLISSLLGQTSRNMRKVFEYAQLSPSVLFLDEFDALASARGNERDVGELQRVVISLLQNIDSLPDNIILIAATNHEQLLDPAVWRRFSFRIPMPLPNLELRGELWKNMLGNYAPEKIDLNSLSEKSANISGAIIQQVCLDAKRQAILSGKGKADEIEIYKRLGLAIALNTGQLLSTIDDEICWLRQWNSKIFSLRRLSSLYNISVRQINNMNKGNSYADQGE